MIPLRHELAAFRGVQVLAGFDDFAEMTGDLPEVVVRGVEGDWGEADDVRRAEVGDDTAAFEGFGDAGTGVVLDGDVAAAPAGLAWGADAIAVRVRGQSTRLEQVDQVGGLGDRFDADLLDAGLGEETEGAEKG